MELKLEIFGLDEAVSRLDKVSTETQNKLKDAMDASLRDIQEEARTHHRFTTRSGDAERSIDIDKNYRSGNFYGAVGTTRKVTVYLHTGTKPHAIRPKQKLALRWAGGSGFIFAKRVWHPGTKKDPFIFDALNKNRGAIISRFSNAVRTAIGEAY
jgi:HK97 gp10 family phage protein